MFELLSIQQIFAETLAQIHIHLAKSAFALDEIVEMLVHKSPFLIFRAAHLSEIGKEVSFLFGLIQEAEFLVDERLDTDASDGFRFVQHLIVERPFHFVFGVGVNVDAEIFPAAHLHRFGVAHCRIIIQIQRNSVVANRSLANGHFCTGVIHN